MKRIFYGAYWVLGLMIFSLSLDNSYGRVYISGDAPTINTSISSITVKHAHDGAGDDRANIGIGEHVELSAPVTEELFSDPDLCHESVDDPWVTFYDSLGASGYEKEYGCGEVGSSSLANGVLTCQLTAQKVSTEGDIIVKLYARNAGKGFWDVDDATKFKTFHVKVPSYITLVQSVALWSGPPAANPQYIGGYVQNIYKVWPQAVNWENDNIGEWVPEKIVTWPNGECQAIGPFNPMYPTNTHGDFIDGYKTAKRPISLLNGQSFSFSQYGWLVYDGGGSSFTTFGDWYHTDSFSSSGVDTMSFNGGSVPGQGPYATKGVDE